MRKKAYHHGNLKRALIDVAVEVVARHGIDALNLRALAARAGVSPGAPYHHFASRNGLLAAIAEEGFMQFETSLITARDAAPTDAGARLEAIGQAYLRFATFHPGYFRVMFHGDAGAAGPTESGERAFQLLHDAIVDCQRAGTAPAGDPAPLVLTAWSVVHGLATLWIDRALPFKGLEPDLMAPKVGQLMSRMFAAAARSDGAG
jgi:AcrR family transcriptional regulator